MSKEDYGSALYIRDENKGTYLRCYTTTEVIDIMQKNKDDAIAYLEKQFILIEKVDKEELQNYVKNIFNHTIKLLRRSDYEQ